MKPNTFYRGVSSKLRQSAVGGYLSLFAERTIHFRVAVLDPSMRHDSFYFGPAHRISLMMTVRQSGGGKKRRGEEMRRGEESAIRMDVAVNQPPTSPPPSFSH